MKSAPSILTYLNEESAAYFEKVKQYLNDLGISYEIDPNLVRGLDYYNHTAFEIMSNAEGFGAITTLAGGGRYDGLVEQIGGPEAPGIGFAMSIERMLAAIDAEKENCLLIRNRLLYRHTRRKSEGLFCFIGVQTERSRHFQRN